MVRDILIMLAAVAAIVAFAPKVSHGVNTPASEATNAAVTADRSTTAGRAVDDGRQPRDRRARVAR